jgi:hypothetical protein
MQPPLGDQGAGPSYFQKCAGREAPGAMILELLVIKETEPQPESGLSTSFLLRWSRPR